MLYIIVTMILFFLIFLFSSLKLAKEADKEMEKYKDTINKSEKVHKTIL